MRKFRPYVYVITAASLWGIIAIFVKGLQEAGFSSFEITAIRAVSAIIFLLIIGLWKYRDQLKVRFQHLPLFIGTGIFSIVLFNWSYFTAIEEMSISIAVILLYTAPAFVAVMSAVFLKEKLTSKKVISILGTITGCILIAGITGEAASTITAYGFFIGLCSGFGYALYTIFSKVSLKWYSPFAITFYTFLVAVVFLFPASKLWAKHNLFFEAEVFIYSIGLGLFPTVLAYVIYTEALKSIDGSSASILATTEPVVAMFLGMLVFNESLLSIQWLGSIIILLSVIFVHWNGKSKKAKNHSINM